MLYARAAATVVPILLFAGFVSAQQPDCRQRTIPITVLNKKNGQVIDASSLRFQGSYRGKSIPVTTVAGNEGPPRVLVLMDTSGSMREGPARGTGSMGVPVLLSPPVETSLALFSKLLSDLPLQTQVAFAAFGTRTELLVGLTNDRKELLDAAVSLHQDLAARVIGPTALWDAIHESKGILGNADIGDSVYVITDGQDNASNAKRESVLIEFNVSGIRLFFVQLPLVQASSSSERTRIQTLAQHLQAQYTGGWVLGSARFPTLAEEFDVQRRLLQVSHRLTIELPEVVDRPRDWELRLTNVTPAVRKDLELVYPRKLVPCS